jgi:hypothetical protein
MSCAIMQPTYLPWAGYFNLLASVDDFVFLDDVQFERQSWQSRNRILLEGREHLVVVPVASAPLATPISAITVKDERPWRGHHAQLLASAYRKAPHGDFALQVVLPCIADTSLHRLADLNIRIIQAVCDALGLAPRLHRASELACPGSRSEHLARICERIGTDDYLSPAGSLGYLQEDDFAARYGKRLTIQSFAPAPYRQLRTDTFVSHLSVVDVLAHLGPDQTLSYIRGTHHEDRQH